MMILGAHMNNGGYVPLSPDFDEHALVPWDYYTREPFLPHGGKL